MLKISVKELLHLTSFWQEQWAFPNLGRKKNKNRAQQCGDSVHNAQGRRFSLSQLGMRGEARVSCKTGWGRKRKKKITEEFLKAGSGKFALKRRNLCRNSSDLDVEILTWRKMWIWGQHEAHLLKETKSNCITILQKEHMR